jgi:hypothetical protein
MTHCFGGFVATGPLIGGNTFFFAFGSIADSEPLSTYVVFIWEMDSG